MPKPGWRTVSIRTQRLAQLDKIYKTDSKKPSNQEFGGWLDNLLSEFIEFRNDVKRYGAFLEFKDVTDNWIQLFDFKSQRTVDIKINGTKKQLECQAREHPNSACCIHIGFCFAIPRIYKVLMNQGFTIK